MSINQYNTQEVTGTTVLDYNTRQYIVNNTSGANITLTLPPLSDGFQGSNFLIMRIDTNLANTVQLVCSGSDVFNGSNIGGNDYAPTSAVISVSSQFVIVATTNVWNIYNYSPDRSRGSFGTGADGKVTINANTPLVRDMYYESLTINSGFTLSTGGFKIYVAGTLTLVGTATIACVGGNASGLTAGAGAPAGTSGSGSTGGAGRNTAGAGNAGSALTSVMGASGGSGGAANASSGGSGGTVTALTVALGGPRPFDNIQNAVSGRAISGIAINGGTGGGGGAAIAASTSGAGGGGGGLIFIIARNIVVTGVGPAVITAAGGNGSNATVGTAGGGGGGGGGVIIIVVGVGNLRQNIPSSVLTITAAGGTGGLGITTGGGNLGQPGADGNPGLTTSNVNFLVQP
jgi:hypothetical protein